ncbi:MAG: hypothetical protein KGQ48_09800, partial [Bradyrhizobium sp.]|nr:hypothetical protein [Bradyrhizobium sp.]
MQESDALHAFGPQAFGLGSALGRTDRFLPVSLVPVGLRMTVLTTASPVTARAFCGRGFIWA